MKIAESHLQDDATSPPLLMALLIINVSRVEILPVKTKPQPTGCERVIVLVVCSSFSSSDKRQHWWLSVA